jgi:hypothetical protein
VGVWVDVGVWVYGCVGVGAPVHACVSGWFGYVGIGTYGCVGVGGSMVVCVCVWVYSGWVGVDVPVHGYMGVWGRFGCMGVRVRGYGWECGCVGV